MDLSNPQLERIPPVVLYSLLNAVRRFEPDFYAHLCRAYHLDADRIFGLFTDFESLGSGQLPGILTALREHQAYHDIVYLAGRNTLLMWVKEQRVKLGGLGKPSQRFAALVKQLLPPFLGQANYNIMARGNVQFVEVRNSLFARGIDHSHPVCGFYSGLMAQLVQEITGKNPVVSEVRCLASDPEATSCMFQAAL